MRDKDPLKIYKAIEKADEKKSLQPITKDQYEAWLANPVTQRLHEHLAIDALRTMLSRDASEVERACSHELMQIIDWEPLGMTNDE